MDWVIGELPLHPLIVHFTVIAIPLAAVCLVLSAVWPAARRRLGIITPLIALAALVAVPLTTQAGEWLATRVGQTPLLARHESLGDTMLPWAVALFAVAAIQWAWYRFGSEGRARPVRLTATAVLVAASLVVAVGSVVTIVQIGESGAAAVWTGSFSDQPVEGG